MRTVAVDWSGRKQGAASHIWVAEVVSGALVFLENGRNREQVADWLIEEAARGDPLAVGLDFAFSLPAWYLSQLGAFRVGDLWDRVETEGEQWLHDCAPPFWGRPGKKKPQGQEPYRRTELEVATTGGIGPKSVFQIGGAGAVGTGSIRGMPVLARLSSEGFGVWPFDPPGWPCAFEIYPRLLTGPVKKSVPAVRLAYLEELGWPLEEALRTQVASTEDAFDAAVSALRMYEHAGDLTHPPKVPSEAALEGWIWEPREPIAPTALSA